MIITHGLSDGQVLQRLRNQTATAVVRGECAGAGVVTATIYFRGKALKGWSKRSVGRAARGAFTARLAGIPEGGPFHVKLSVGDESVIVRRVQVGDVWLLAGQSNMQGRGRMTGAPKPHPKVHAMFMDDRWNIAREPLHLLEDSPDPAHCPKQLPLRVRDQMRKVARLGVGPGIFFAKEMVKRSGGVPQALIPTAHGGTSMQQWDPAKKKLGGVSLYGSMLRSWRKTGQPLAGVLWYQGESDANEKDAPLYTARMKKLISAMRRDFGQPRLPFILVQLGQHYDPWGGNTAHWNSIQEQQLKLGRVVKNVACVPAADLPLDDTIHISSEGYARLGVRLARMADRLACGNRCELPPPELVSMRIVQTPRLRALGARHLVLTFKNVIGNLRAAGTPTGFTLVDPNHRSLSFFSKTILSGNKVLLETTHEVDSKAFKLMHGHGKTPYVNITDSRDMLIPVFGPEFIEQWSVALTPWVVNWLVSDIQPAKRPVASLPPPLPSAALNLKKKDYEMSFIDEHVAWGGNSGQNLFFSEILLSEPMKLNLLVGYDGPFKVWIDGKPVFCDPKGTNPAVPDEGIARVNLGAGKHKIAVAIDLNDGNAWGFYLRFSRRDVSRARILNGDYAVPKCVL
jgi:sialate O-acetylesterase